MKKQPPHGATKPTTGTAKRKGMMALFEHYHITVATIIREYTQDDRKEAPADSSQSLGIK